LGDIDTCVVLAALGKFNKSLDELVSLDDKCPYSFKEEALASGRAEIPPFNKIGDLSKDNSAGLTDFYQARNKVTVDRDGDITDPYRTF